MKLTQVEVYKKRSPRKKIGEDDFVVNEELGIYGVFDGATPIDTFLDEKGFNGAYKASHIFKKYFTNIQKDMSIVDHVKRANRRLSEEMSRYSVDKNKKENLWCTCVSVIRILDDFIEYAHLGDTMIITYDDNSYKLWTEDTVEGITDRAREIRKQMRLSGETLEKEEFYEIRENRLRFQRQLANTIDGYSVANGTEEVDGFIQYGRIKIDEIKGILLFTDGVFPPNNDWSLLVKYLREGRFNAYVDLLESIEKSTGSKSDDRTCIRITL